jgi:chorismate synthase
MIRLIEKMRQAGDTVGGIVEGVARGVPPGWGEPVFDRLEADLAKAMLSLPASKGFDIGSGFGGILLTGTQHNDPFRAKGGQVYTTSNRSGGIQGGISNGQTIYFRVAFKPVATVMHEQDTVDIKFKNTTLKARGRHDPCVLPRAVPIVEAMTALVLVDHALRHQAQCGWHQRGDEELPRPLLARVCGQAVCRDRRLPREGANGDRPTAHRGPPMLRLDAALWRVAHREYRRQGR